MIGATMHARSQMPNLSEPLAKLIERRKPAVSAEDPWTGKRFEWVRRLNPIGQGTVGAQLYLDVFKRGRIVGDPGKRGFDYDIHDGERKVEAKLATRSVQRSTARRLHEQYRYTWQGLRLNQTWTHAWLVAVDFDDVRAFLVPRTNINGTSKDNEIQCWWAPSQSTPEPPQWLAEHEVGASPVDPDALAVMTRAVSRTDLPPEERILGYLAGKPDGARSEDIRSALGFSRDEFTIAVTSLVARGTLESRFNTRARRYLLNR